VLNVMHRRSDSIVWVQAGRERRAIFVVGHSPVKVDRPVVCGMPCCDLHRQEMDEGVVYCLSHRLDSHWSAKL
jgi:hypothetical protein